MSASALVAGESYALDYVLRVSAQPQPAGSTQEAEFASRDVLQYIVDNNLSNQKTLSKILAKVDFHEAFTSLATDELLQLLLNQGQIVGYSSVTQVKVALPSRGVNPTTLRPDGLLTALATTDNGSILAGTPTAVKQQLADYYQASEANQLAFLDVYSNRRLLELFDDALTTSAADARRQITAYTLNKLAADQTDKNSPNYIGNIFPIESVNTTGTGSGLTLPNPQVGVNEIKKLPPGLRTLTTNNLFLVEGFGAYAPTFLNGFIDARDAQGRSYDYFMLWSDEWEKIVKARIDDYFRQFRDLVQQQLVNTGQYASVNEALDLFFIDMEDKGFSWQDLRQERRVNQLISPTKSIWEAIQSDARWSTMKAKLKAAGLTDNDLSLAVLPTWSEAQNDPRISLWNAVMEEHRAGYLNRAIYEPIRKYFPNVKFANYGNFYHAQTLPTGNFVRMTESTGSVGVLNGNLQGDNFYGDYAPILTGDPARPVISPSPKPDYRIRTLDFTPIYQVPGNASTPIVAGEIVITLFERVPQLHVGDKIVLENRGANYINYDYQGAYTIRSLGEVVINGTPMTTIGLRKTTTKNLPDHDLSNRGNVDLTAYVDVYNSYGGLVFDVKNVRSMVASSSAGVFPWIGAPDYREFRFGQDFEHWQEGVYHLALSGVQDFAYWRYSYMGVDPEGNQLASRVLSRVSDLAGFQNTRPLALNQAYVEWEDPWVLSGIEAGGRRVYRLTPNPEAGVTVTSSTVNGIPLVTIAAPGETSVVLRYASLENPALDPEQRSDGQPLGYWIVQNRAADDWLTGSVDAVLDAVQAGLGAKSITIAGPNSIVRGQNRSFTITPEGLTAAEVGGQFNYLIDWNGDGTTDESYVGPAGLSIERTFPFTGTYNVRVTSTGPTGIVRTGLQTVSVGFWALQPNAARPEQTDLVYGGSTGNDAVTISTTAAGGINISAGTVGGPVTSTIGPVSGVTGQIIVFGQAGNDQLNAAASSRAVELRGGQGNDTLIGGTGSDTVYGDEGDDVLSGGTSADSLYGGVGNDNLSGNDGDDLLVGEDGHDTLVGSNGSDILMGRTGNDSLVGGAAYDILLGDEGDDFLDGGDDGDWLFGGSGFDILLGGNGDDRLRGDGDRNLLIGGAGRDVFEIQYDGGDLLVAGTTAFDSNGVALQAVLAEWSSSRSYIDRLLNLAGLSSGTRLNGSFFLLPGSTVFDDSAADNIYGGVNVVDWLFFNPNDDTVTK